ncbi:MAG TPA: hypothetical protein VF407_05905 [Polyangiaceae bacterium]
MTHLRLASAEEARVILEAEDDFTRALGGFDRSFRLRKTTPVTDAEVRRFFGEQALDFTADEAKAWNEAIAEVSRAAKAIEDALPAEVLVLKTTGREERGHAYTRQNAIVLPSSRVQSWRGERAVYLLAHELFHVASRASRKVRDATYELLGFGSITPITLPPELDDRRQTNPDAYDTTHCLRLGDRTVVPLMVSSLPIAQAATRSSVLDVAPVRLLAIDPDDGEALRDADGALLLIDPESTEWAERIGRNTRYTLHPEEVLADNHALLVRKALGHSVTVADPEFLAAFEVALRTRGSA